MHVAKGESVAAKFGLFYPSQIYSFMFLCQVLNLLDSMGLTQHQNAFMAERVNGEILLECDDTVLQEELKVQYVVFRATCMTSHEFLATGLIQRLYFK